MQLYLWNRYPGRRSLVAVFCGALLLGWILGAAFWPSIGPALRSVAEAGVEHLLNDDDTVVGGSGTGFVVNDAGHILTNAHVVEECGSITALVDGSERSLTLLATDPGNDLAVLKIRPPLSHFALLREQDARLAEPVVVTGFPMKDYLSSTIHITTGVVSNLAGLGDDTSSFQITAPVQPGNSGSPVLDQSGNVLGVLSAGVDQADFIEETGDISQNTNFAIKASVVRAFLESRAIPFTLSTEAEHVGTEAIVTDAALYTLSVSCEE